MRVNLSVKKAMYEDLKVISDSMGIPVPTLVRNIIEQDFFKKYIHDVSILIQSQGLDKTSTPKDIMQDITNLKH